MYIINMNIKQKVSAIYSNYFRQIRSKGRKINSQKLQVENRKLSLKNLKENKKVNKNKEKQSNGKIVKEKQKIHSTTKDKSHQQTITSLLFYNQKSKQKNGVRNVKKQNHKSPELRDQYDLGKKKNDRKLIQKGTKMSSQEEERKLTKQNVKQGQHKKLEYNPQSGHKDRQKSLKQIKSMQQFNTETSKEGVEQRKQRHTKFQFRSQKYSRLILQLKKEGQQVEGSKTCLMRNIKPKSLYKRRVSKLQKQIDNFRSLSIKSEEVLNKMSRIKRREQKKYKKEKEIYLLEIKKLEEQLKEYRPNIGHLFSYEEYKNGKLVPESVIPEGWEQHSNLGVRVKQKSEEEVQREGQQIISKYMMEMGESGESQVTELCLSILSNRSEEG